MGDIDTVKRVRLDISRTNPDLVELFDDAWQIQEDGTLKRTSSLQIDIAFVTWLCEHGFDGYIATSIGAFHPEVFMCAWSNNLELTVTYDAIDVVRADFATDFYRKRMEHISFTIYPK